MMKCIKIIGVINDSGGVVKSVGAIRKFPGKNFIILNLVDD